MPCFCWIVRSIGLSSPSDLHLTRPNPRYGAKAPFYAGGWQPVGPSLNEAQPPPGLQPHFLGSDLQAIA